MSKNTIPCQSILSIEDEKKLYHLKHNNLNIEDSISYIANELNIQITSDPDIVKGFKRDYSNIPGDAEILCRPVNEKECAIMLQFCQHKKIPVTIAAGRTNLNGSATPKGGMVISIEKMTDPNPILDLENKYISSPVGIYLEDMRNTVLEQSQHTLHFPVDPTSRKEAMIGGAISCNASGFVPGPAGAMRYWTESLDFLTPNGFKITCKRGEYISNNGIFILDFPTGPITWDVLTYPRPDIKNASGPYSDENGMVDLVDFLVGSEGIFGLITSVTFRLKRTPDNYLDLFFTLPSEKDAVQFHGYIQNYLSGDLSKLTALEYFGFNCQNYMDHKEKLFHSESEVGIYLQIPLYNKKIEDEAEKWLDILQSSKCGINEDAILLLNNPNDWQTFFEARHSIPSNALEKTHRLDTWSILTDTIVPPENFQQFLDVSHELIQKSGIEYLLFGHLGDCHLHFHLIPTKDQQSKALDVYQNIVKKSANLGGVYSAEHGTGKRKRNDFIECFGDIGVEQLWKSKSAVDPHFLLNKGNVIES